MFVDCENRCKLHFHQHPEEFECLFGSYSGHADILLNGVFWDTSVPRLFEKEAITHPSFRIVTIADITDDCNGSVPINLGDQSIPEPVYGVDRNTFEKTLPYLPNSIDVMAVGNLPNELPGDASKYFGEQLIKYVLPDLLTGSSEIIEKATIAKAGRLTRNFDYLRYYAAGEFEPS